MLESLFNKVVDLTPTQVFCRKYCEIFKNTYFEEYLGMGASGILVRNWRIGAIFRIIFGIAYRNKNSQRRRLYFVTLK